MSEYKYACPVCGQHMKCDTSQAGTVMECPTCFQKITAPQAPAAGDSQKFVLTGTKVGERPMPKMAEAGSAATPAAKKFPWGILIVVLVLGLAGAGVFAFRGKLFHHGLGSTWHAGDIGNVGAAGASSLAKRVFTVSGDGADIWDQADSFRFISQAMSGDGTLTVRVLKIQNTNPWAKAGLMIRDSLNPDSRFAAVLVTPASGIAFQQRDRAGVPATSVVIVPNLTAPYWVRLVRQGNSFTAYSSVNGTSWAMMGSTTIPMGNQVRAGLAVCSHNFGTLCEAQFDKVTVESDPKAGQAAAPPIILPPASDTNWTLKLDPVQTPEAAAVGRIHGQSSTLNRATYQDGVLTFRPGVKGSPDVSLVISFGGALPEAIAGNTINVAADAEKAAGVSLRWKENGQSAKQSFDSGYALRLEMGALEKNHMPGKIYFCAPDESKSYVMGTFNVEVRKPKPPKPK